MKVRQVYTHGDTARFEVTFFRKTIEHEEMETEADELKISIYNEHTKEKVVDSDDMIHEQNGFYSYKWDTGSEPVGDYILRFDGERGGNKSSEERLIRVKSML